MANFTELLGAYFDAAHAEGRERRTHDTVDGAAQRALNDLQEFLKTRISDEVEACAKLMELKRADLLLLGGEMSAQEIRTVQAVLTNRAAVIRRRLPQ